MAVVEPGMLAWFFVRLDAQTFALFDVFNEDANRQAHLSGPMAAALMPRADELLAHHRFVMPTYWRICCESETPER